MRHRALTVAVALAGLALGAPAAHADTTVFKGRFACLDHGVEVPIADARVEPYAIPEHASAEDLASVAVQTYANAVTFPFTGWPGVSLPSGGQVRGPYLYTGPDGEWSFEVQRKSDSVPGADVWVRLVLDDDLGTAVTDYPSTDAASYPTDTNLNDKPVQDYRTLVIDTRECAIWLGLKRAREAYTGLTGREAPFGAVVASYGAPNRGFPYTAYDRIVWPADYPAEGATATSVAAAHEFAHLIRNAGLGSAANFLDEVSATGFPGPDDALDYRLRHDPCTRTTPKLAFHEGWAEFWAGDFLPAPPCPGVADTDTAYEANVAWILTRMERGCTAAGRRRMVELLLTRGRKIHSIDDFRRELGGCQGGPIEPGSVARSPISSAVRAGRWVDDIKGAIKIARGAAAGLNGRLDDVRRAAKTPPCLRLPCTTQLERKLAPALTQSTIRQDRLLAAALADQVSSRSRRLLEQRPNLASLRLIRTVPAALTRSLARATLGSVDRALRAAQPIARRDHSSVTTTLIKGLRSVRADLVRARRSGRGMPLGLRDAGLRALPLRSVPTNHVITFDEFPDGAPIMDQTRGAGAVLGPPFAVGFPGVLPPHMCTTDPPSAAGGAALAPSCPSDPSGYFDSGTMAMLTTPARSVSMRVGTTEARPGGFAVHISAYDAGGGLVIQNATLVGSSTDGQGTGATELLTTAVPPGIPGIAWIAIYFDGSFPTPARLVFDDLGFTDE